MVLRHPINSPWGVPLVVTLLLYVKLPLGQAQMSSYRSCTKGCSSPFYCDTSTNYCITSTFGTYQNPCRPYGVCNPGLYCRDTYNYCENSCFPETQSMMEALKENYNVSQVTTQTAILQNKTILIMDDFTTNQVNNLAYKRACNAKGGNYVELYYNAICEAQYIASGGGGGGGDGKTIANLFVSGQPRCYSQYCTDDFTTYLFEELTIRPTEDRADLDSHSTQTWTCTGTFRDKSINLCQTMSDEIYNTQGVQKASASIQPQVKEQTEFGLVKEEKLLTFTGYDSSKFSQSCASAGGSGYEANGSLTCGTSKFQMTKFPICLWPLCGNLSSVEADGVLDTRVHSLLVDDRAINGKYVSTCTFTSSVQQSHEGFPRRILGYATVLLLFAWLFP